MRRASDPALEREIKATLGSVPELPRHLMSVPWLMRVSLTMGGYTPRELPRELADLTFFVVSRDNACRYCAGLGRTLLRVFGYRDATIDRLERELPIADLDPQLEPALDVARKLSRFNPPPRAAEFARLRKLGLGDAAINELVYVAATTAHANRLATFLDVPLEPFAEQRKGLLFRLTSPLIRRSIRAKRRAWTPPAAAPPGPYEPLLANLSRTPVLQQTIRWALARSREASRVPRRSAAMLTAVVARALDCPRAEALARADARVHGLADDEAALWLQRLTAPGMSELERALIPLARETTRYQSHLIKPRFAALSERFDDETVIEAVGLYAQANMLCRLEPLEHAQ